jgi:hypothetical protein
MVFLIAHSFRGAPDAGVIASRGYLAAFPKQHHIDSM